MINLLLILLLAALTLVAITLQKTYSRVPARELKRRAASGDEFAKVLHRAVGYGISLQILLWIIIGLTSSGFFVLLGRSVPGWLAVIGSASLLWVGFAWLPQAGITALSQKAARVIAPILESILKYVAPLFDRLGGFLRTNGRLSFHTGLYQKEDLLELLDKQNAQLDSRISSEELRLAQHALTFDDQTVGQVMTPRRVIKTVSAAEAVGPLLLDELHKSGFSRFPVYDGKPDNIVGTLYLRTLVAEKAKGTVRERMSKSVYYVNEDKSLIHVLNAFIKTKHHLFIVVNSFEEISGVITIEDVLEQLIGRKIVDEFDRYDDLRAVAALEARKEQKSHKHPTEDDTPEEVV